MNSRTDEVHLMDSLNNLMDTNGHLNAKEGDSSHGWAYIITSLSKDPTQ